MLLPGVCSSPPNPGLPPGPSPTPRRPRSQSQYHIRTPYEPQNHGGRCHPHWTDPRLGKVRQSAWATLPESGTPAPTPSHSGSSPAHCRLSQRGPRGSQATGTHREGQARGSAGTATSWCGAGLCSQLVLPVQALQAPPLAPGGAWGWPGSGPWAPPRPTQPKVLKPGGGATWVHQQGSRHPQADRAPPAGVSDVPTTPAHQARAQAPRSHPPWLGPGCS